MHFSLLGHIITIFTSSFLMFLSISTSISIMNPSVDSKSTTSLSKGNMLLLFIISSILPTSTSISTLSSLSPMRKLSSSSWGGICYIINSMHKMMSTSIISSLLHPIQQPLLAFDPSYYQFNFCLSHHHKTSSLRSFTHNSRHYRHLIRKVKNRKTHLPPKDSPILRQKEIYPGYFLVPSSSGTPSFFYRFKSSTCNYLSSSMLHHLRLLIDILQICFKTIAFFGPSSTCNYLSSSVLHHILRLLIDMLQICFKTIAFFGPLLCLPHTLALTASSNLLSCWIINNSSNHLWNDLRPSEQEFATPSTPSFSCSNCLDFGLLLPTSNVTSSSSFGTFIKSIYTPFIHFVFSHLGAIQNIYKIINSLFMSALPSLLLSFGPALLCHLVMALVLQTHLQQNTPSLSLGDLDHVFFGSSSFSDPSTSTTPLSTCTTSSMELNPEVEVPLLHQLSAMVLRYNSAFENHWMSTARSEYERFSHLLYSYSPCDHVLPGSYILPSSILFSTHDERHKNVFNYKGDVMPPSLGVEWYDDSAAPLTPAPTPVAPPNTAPRPQRENTVFEIIDDEVQQPIGTPQQLQRELQLLPLSPTQFQREASFDLHHNSDPPPLPHLQREEQLTSSSPAQRREIETPTRQRSSIVSGITHESNVIDQDLSHSTTSALLGRASSSSSSLPFLTEMYPSVLRSSVLLALNQQYVFWSSVLVSFINPVILLLGTLLGFISTIINVVIVPDFHRLVLLPHYYIALTNFVLSGIVQFCFFSIVLQAYHQLQLLNRVLLPVPLLRINHHPSHHLLLLEVKLGKNHSA